MGVRRGKRASGAGRVKKERKSEKKDESKEAKKSKAKDVKRRKVSSDDSDEYSSSIDDADFQLSVAIAATFGLLLACAFL